MTTSRPLSVASTERSGPWSRLLAAIYDPFLALGERRGMERRRARLLSAARGDVLEIGAGTGLNLRHYPPAVTALTLSEPEAAMRSVLQRRVARAELPFPTAVTPDRAETLPFADAAFDVVVSTLVLCTAADPVVAAGEVRRVLRPGGRFLVIEHVRAEAGTSLVRWQHRLAGPWKAFANGCRCSQETVPVLADAGFDVAALRQDRWRGMPAIVAPLVVGALSVSTDPRREP